VNLRALSYFVKLAELRHFSKAAEACHVSQPTLSTQIRRLEEELGVQLIERAPRNVMLTPVGAEIARRARQVLRDVDEIRASAERSRDPSAGVLRVGLFPTLAPYLLPHVIPGLRTAYPNLRLQLYEEKTADILDMLHAGELDAGLLALPIPDEGLMTWELFEEPFVLAAPEEHTLAQQKRLSEADLAGQELLLLEDGHCLRDQALEVCRLAGAREKVDFHATSLETLRQMVAAGAGITLLPTLAIKPPVPPTEHIVLRAFENNAPHRKIAMVWRASSAMRDFLGQLAPHFARFDRKLLDPGSDA